jgi:hypothetical protein
MYSGGFSMRLFRSARWIFLALLLCLVPAASFAGVFISVGFAPPVLPVYEQPPCPEPGLMWTPGYWAYGPDGYYWVPGAWVPAPYEGALWTPGYWGWSSGLYVWHLGYWGPHVGYYGGVNYGFGYMGVGFAGGIWRGHDFVYNTAVVRVNTTVIHNTYIDRTVVERNTIVNDRHVAFSGGPGGINHAPSADERVAMNEHHQSPTSFQTQHVNAAMNDHSSYFKSNGGHPQNLAASRPLPVENHLGATGLRPTQQGSSFNNNGGGSKPTLESQPHSTNQYHPAPQNEPRNEPRNESRPGPQSRPQHENKEPKGK